MNLLVTNARNAQAYAIIRALRPHARKIVVTMYGKNRLAARLSHAANSRLVDKRYYVPSPVEDWRAGRIQRENTEREETYIQAVVRICEAEKIDTIFPSFDPQVYVLSKNKERFERMGVLIPIPDYDTVVTPLDKYRTIQAAQEVGFPCPRTYLPESEKDLQWIAEEVGFPLVVKPRFSSGGRGVGIVRNLSALSENMEKLVKTHGVPLVQEYIPGRNQECLRLVIGNKGDLKVSFSEIRYRTFTPATLDVPTVVESTGAPSCLLDAVKVVQKLGWWGGTTVQVKVDPRDGLPKLMEINPRLGYRLWNRTELGINEPLICIKIARGEDVEEVKHYTLGVLLVDPVEDTVGLALSLLDLLAYKVRVGVLGKIPLDPHNPPLSLKPLAQSFNRTYFNGKRKIFNPYFRYFFQDPLVSILWWCQFSTLMLGAVKQLGR